MASINKMFSNMLSHLTRTELIEYLSAQLTDNQIKKILNNLNENTKVEILENRFKGKVEDLLTGMASVAEKINDFKKEEAVNQKLEILKGRIILARLVQKLAANTADEKRSLEANQNLNAVFMEYKMCGGEDAFHSFDSSTPKILSETFLLNKYWTQEMQIANKKSGATSFTKWGISAEETRSYLGENNFKLLEKFPERQRHYFFGNFFVSKLKRSGTYIYGIGSDSKRNEFPDKILKHSKQSKCN